MISDNIKTICVVGLGYVGLPLIYHFSKHFEVIGFDIKKERVEELNQGKDSTRELSAEQLTDLRGRGAIFTAESSEIKKADFICVCVPTPVDENNRPDFSCLESASEIVGKNLKQGAIVVYESTVHPGATEEICLPILEKESGMSSADFRIGYSPERINPADKEHTIDKIVKVVAGQDKETTEIIAEVYAKIITAGIHKAPNIKTAEAAKVIENVQRDLNIALINELSKIFDKMDIRTKNVIEAASTKWNFHKYSPGLVGGHCIGVDPYYLTEKAKQLGYDPEVILAGREVNDTMHQFVIEKLNKLLEKGSKPLSQAKVLVMGLTFKEDVPDARNSRARFLIKELKDKGAEVLACEPLLPDEAVEKEFGIKNHSFESIDKVDAVIITVPHKVFSEISLDQLKEKLTNPPILVDLKGMFNRGEAEEKGFVYDEL